MSLFKEELNTVSKTIETSPKSGEKKTRKKFLIVTLIAITAVSAGIVGTWYGMKIPNIGEMGSASPKAELTTFVDLDVFTVNLLPEENNQYLQVGLTAKTRETTVIAEIKKQMPDIRNRVLLLLSSQQAASLASIAGKQQLSRQITDEIKQSLNSEELQEDVLEVLFTSFVMQ